MLPIPNDIAATYEVVLKKRVVPLSRHADYKKWLRYFLDFRGKYPLPDSRSEQVRLFIQKLREKKQTPEQQKQAAHAVSLFYQTQSNKKSTKREFVSSKTQNASLAVTRQQETPSSAPPPLKMERKGAEAPAGERAQRSGSRFNEWAASV